MTWSQNATTKVWTNTGAGRSVVVALTAFPGLSALSLSVTNPASNVKAIVLASVDGRTCYECGIEGVNVIIRRVAFGVAGATVTNTAADTPPSAAASAAHGLAANTPYVLDVRLYEGVIEVRLNGALQLRHTVDPDDYFTVENAYANLIYYGFASEVSGAVISRAEIAPLVQSEPTPMTEILVIACDGNLLITEDGVNVQTIASGVLGNDGLVSMVEYQRKVWIVGTGVAKVFDPDPAALTVSDWTAAAGTFPGSSGLPAGQTRCTLAENFLDRIIVGGDPIDPQNAIMTAVGDATDFDTAADTDGRAFELSTGLTGRIGQPITCIKQAANGVLVFGCTGQIWRLVGDPALGTPSLTPASLSSGLTGKDSAVLADASTLVAHSPDGAFAIGSAPGAPAIPLSQAVLREGIEIDRDAIASYYQITVRDPTRKQVYFFLTPVTSGPATHYVYDELVGGYQPKLGGWFEDVYDPAVGPTAACMFRGKLCLGTRDGRILYVSEDATDDDGTAFTSRAPLTLLDPKASNHDLVRVEAVSLVMADESDAVTLRAYRGRTAQEAMTGAGRSLAWARDVSPRAGEITQTLSAPAVCFELWNESASRAWEFESLTVDYTIERNAARAGWTTPAAGRVPCTIPASATGGSGDDGPGAGALAPFVPDIDPLFASQTAYEADTLDPNLVFVLPPGHTDVLLYLGSEESSEDVGEDIAEY